ncbi:hypothetical protein [Mucilaginibacter sp.]
MQPLTSHETAIFHSLIRAFPQVEAGRAIRSYAAGIKRECRYPLLSLMRGKFSKNSNRLQNLTVMPRHSKHKCLSPLFNDIISMTDTCLPACDTDIFG